MQDITTAPLPLSILSEEEAMFRDAVREFAETEVKPYVSRDGRGRDSSGPTSSRSSSSSGLMGIEVPEQYGGAGGSIFIATLAVEELTRVDASAAIYVDVQNTLVNNALLRWGNDEQKARYLPRMTTDLARRLRALRAGQRQRRLRARRPRPRRRATAGCSPAASSGSPTAPRPGSSSSSPTPTSRKGYKGITAFLVERDFPGFAVGKKENKLGIRASSTTELILEGCEVPDENVLGPVGQGYKIAIETLNEGRIGIGAQMIGVAPGALEAALEVREGAEAVRQGDRRVPGHPVPARADGHRARGRAAHGLQRARGSRTRASRLPPRPPWPSSSAPRSPSGSPRCASSCSAATATRRSTRSRSSTATPRSARSTRGRATCSCRRSPRCSSSR